LTPEETSQLTDEALFTYEGLVNNDPSKVSYYLENANRAQKKFARELSPSTNIKKLKAKTFTLMDVNNIYIPYTEAEMLDKALGEKDHVFVKTQLLPAGDLNKSLSLKNYPQEVIKIFKFVYSVLREIS
jgi:hypothetical protein